MTVETFQDILKNVCLVALAISLAALAGVALRRVTKLFMKQLTVFWHSLTAFGRVAVVSFAFVCFLYGGGKTNLPLLIIRPLRGLARSAAAVQRVDAHFFASNWNRRGAWRDSLQFDFDGEWLFPWGDGHLSSVEVMSWGEIRPGCGDTNVIVGIGVPLAIVPGLTEFSCEATQMNSYRFAWANAAVNRDTSNLVSASIELKRCGDIIVTTNGVSRVVPRVLPFAHDGFGQDAEWVAANFSNATEMAEAGYAEWVDAQIGSGLTNGYFKFTAAFTETPPETVQLVVGDYSIAVTNAGEYVFLLEKGTEYAYGTQPFLTNVTYSAVDDIPEEGLRLMSVRPGEQTRTWTVDGGYGCIHQTDGSFGRMWWMPTLCGSPSVPHIGIADNPMTFTAVLTDCRDTNGVSFAWDAGAGLTIVSPGAQTTAVQIDEMPSWAETTLSVSATIGNHTLNSYLDGLTYGTNDTPQIHLALNIPVAVLLNSNAVSRAKIATAGWSFSSDAPTSGVVHVSCVSGSDKVLSSGLLGEWSVTDLLSVSATVEGMETSDAVGDVVFSAAFISDGGETNAVARAMTVVRTDDVSIPSAPEDGLVVLTNTPIAMHLDCAPSGASSLLSTMWHVRRLKSDGTFSGWNLIEYAHPGASTTFTPDVGGIYEVRALASVSAGGADERYYVWSADENRATGLKRKGDRKAIGVCDEQWQIDFRDCAKSFVGSTDYLEMVDVPAQYGFSSSPGRGEVYKCNLFVAHRAVQSGMTVPAIHGRLWRSYPPLANEWGNRSFAIANWACVQSDYYPQPGFISSHPSGDDTPGHVGIVDFDGMGISAGMRNVNRNFTAVETETVLRRYTGE